MLTLRRGRVSAIVSRADGLTRLEVDGVPCIAYPRLTGPVALGDDVIVNVQARELELGSGGFDVLYLNMTRGLDLAPERDAHVMKLPYAPGQAAVRHAEEGRELPETLGGLPVVCCSLHSQVAPVCAGIGEGVRVAYVQLPGGALPVSLSDALRALRERGLLETTVAVDACVDGDVQCVSVASALVVVCCRGVRRRRVRDRAGRCGHGVELRPWRACGGVGRLAGACARRCADPRGARVGGRSARAAPRRVASRKRRPASLRRRRRGRLAEGLRSDRPAPPFELVDVTGWEAACADLPLSHMGRGRERRSTLFRRGVRRRPAARSRLS